MPFGNDVVDLHDPETQALHPRWDSRVFSPDERRLLEASPRPHLLRWKMWAAKESAFKAASKLRADARFFPTAFTVEFADPDRATVHHEVSAFDIEFEATEHWVHALARVTVPPVTEVGVHARVDELRMGGQHSGAGGVAADGADLPSRQVRVFARDAIAQALDLTAEEISIPAGGIPAAYHRGLRLPIELSLSHHGRYVAFAWAPAIATRAPRAR